MTRTVADTDVVLAGRYRLTRQIASGGMGKVWEAEDELLGRRVAVKLLHDSLASDERFVERFRREARAAAGLSHPNIAQVFDYGEEGGARFIVMEMVRGQTLATLIRRHGQLDPALAARIAAQTALALDAAHRAGIVHRDVKPANIMVTQDGQVKVMDFGIAAAAGAASLTATGTLIGTAAYVAPERVAGEPASPPSDVYSLGVVLYEMLSGSPPFAAEYSVATALAHLHENPPSVALIVGVPPSVAAACHRAMAKDPRDRPPSAAAFARMLRSPDSQAPPPESWADTEILPTPGGDVPETVPSPVLGSSVPPSRAWMAFAAVALAFALSALLGWTLAGTRGGSQTSTSTHAPSTSPAVRSPSATPDSVRVPAVLGDSFEQATEAIRNEGLKVGTVVPVPGEPGVVVRMDPAGGTIASLGDPVSLYVGAAHGRKDHHDHGNHNGNEGD